MAYKVLVPQPAIKPGPLAVKAQSPNHWTAREFPGHLLSQNYIVRKDISSCLELGWGLVENKG